MGLKLGLFHCRSVFTPSNAQEGRAADVRGGMRVAQVLPLEICLVPRFSLAWSGSMQLKGGEV